ncbi:hypothetical protein K2173_000708 [Erythroxylum novogranatense]|uniref:Uncharacterized protein n=1 Tax=Erythroxylum novogranatense TaxID=1862640 RepID=A0AAV8SIB9_9ROSI|nr:hypothetical protein K2173_000708 [Erythroxylum novogranatense]
MMGCDQAVNDEQSEKVLNFSSFPLPHKPEEPRGLATPPICISASIPFEWEEAPGKPRPCCHSKPKAARCLQLPPRLLNQAKVANLPQDFSQLGPSKSQSYFAEESWGALHASKDNIKFLSSSWVNLRKSKDSETGDSCRVTYPVCHACSTDNTNTNGGGTGTVVRITRMKKRSSSFLNLHRTGSYFWTSITEGFKQAVTWKRTKGQVSQLH